MALDSRNQARRSTAWALAAIYAAATLPSPLYLDYRRVFGFSELTLTEIYASYVVGNLAALFFLGRLPIEPAGDRPLS